MKKTYVKPGISNIYTIPSEELMQNIPIGGSKGNIEEMETKGEVFNDDENTGNNIGRNNIWDEEW